MACCGCFFSSFSQKRYTQNDSLYLTALEKYVEGFYPTYLQPTVHGKKQVFIEFNSFFYPFPDSIKGYEVVMLEEYRAIRKTYRENNNALYHIRIFPLDISNDTLTITIQPYHGSYRKKDLHLGVSDRMVVYFVFDCTQKRYVYVKTENSGI